MVALFFCNAKTRYYKSGDYEIEVHAGHKHHYIKINGEIADEITSCFYFHITLQAQREGLDIQVRIGQGFLGNTISTRINGVMVCEKSDY